MIYYKAALGVTKRMCRFIINRTFCLEGLKGIVHSDKTISVSFDYKSMANFAISSGLLLPSSGPLCDQPSPELYHEPDYFFKQISQMFPIDQPIHVAVYRHASELLGAKIMYAIVYQSFNPN